jgi:tetratricopeptide (TPR) repeat protein
MRAELEAAEKLIREARVEKMRGSPQKALAMVKQAAEAAPGAAIVQEALGDDLADRSQLGEALKAYRMALRLDPSNVGVERKHAALVARTSGLGSVEDQLRASLSDSFLPDSSDAMAGGLASVLFTAILPGLGHILVGKIVFGAILLGSWIIGGIWLTIMKSEIPKIFARGQQVNGMVFVPIAIMALTWLVAVQSMTSQTKRRSRRTVDRPLPPVDMKFD